LGLIPLATLEHGFYRDSFSSPYIHNDKTHLEVQWNPHLMVVNLSFSVFLIELLWSGLISLILHLSLIFSSKGTSNEVMTVH
jgi:hypothetical protein